MSVLCACQSERVRHSYQGNACPIPCQLGAPSLSHTRVTYSVLKKGNWLRGYLKTRRRKLEEIVNKQKMSLTIHRT